MCYLGSIRILTSMCLRFSINYDSFREFDINIITFLKDSNKIRMSSNEINLMKNVFD